MSLTPRSGERGRFAKVSNTRSVGAQTKNISRKEEVEMRKVFFITCGLLLFLGTFASAPEALATQPIKFSGSKDFTSKPFDIKSNEWQINWKYKSKKLPNFVLYVFPEGEKANWIEMVKRPRAKEGSGSTYLYTGEGRYYIKVIAKGNPNWSVEVIPKGVSEPLASPATFTGTTDTSTMPFKIRGKEFKLTYTVEPLKAIGYEGAGMSIAVYPRGETQNYVYMTTVGAGTGTRLLEGPGEYSIKVQCPMVKSWKIDVTE